ncbi:hypothetical protein [Rhodococcus sp. UFZ-B548]|uniref:hypothetical protein n=1 Tax=Rhodococcus sp. UFZ-B548 TaxID=2742212 RepID=UPI0015F42C71|nr:hypothetical protein [Rhodococcus sp. UFZ-B548]
MVAVQHQLLGASRFIGLTDLGELPRTAVPKSIERLANGVAPAVRRRLGSTSDSRHIATRNSNSYHRTSKQ